MAQELALIARGRRLELDNIRLFREVYIFARAGTGHDPHTLVSIHLANGRNHSDEKSTDNVGSPYRGGGWYYIVPLLKLLVARPLSRPVSIFSDLNNIRVKGAPISKYTNLHSYRSNSPAFTPLINASHSLLVYIRVVLSGSLVSRTATPCSFIATVTQEASIWAGLKLDFLNSLSQTTGG